MLGAVISEQNFAAGAHQIELLDQNAGVYILEISSATGSRQIKLIKTD